jgi:hypothetical protein
MSHYIALFGIATSAKVAENVLFICNFSFLIWLFILIMSFKKLITWNSNGIIPIGKRLLHIIVTIRVRTNKMQNLEMQK